MLLQQKTHFPSGLDSLPDAKEANNPHRQKTQGQVPLQGPYVLDPRRDAQDVASAEDKRSTWQVKCTLYNTDWEKYRYSEPRLAIVHYVFMFLKDLKELCGISKSLARIKEFMFREAN